METRIAEHRPPAEVPEHEGRAPAPRPRDHQDGRRGEMGQRAANRHVHEEQPERGVLQSRARLQVVELAREEEGADRHRRRFGDERTDQGPDDQDRGPPRARRSPSGVGHHSQGGFSEADDRPRRRQRHDDDHEQGLGVNHEVIEVVLRRLPAGVADHRHQQHQGPEAEDDLDLAEKVQQLGGDARSLAAALGPRAFVVPVLDAVREVGESRRREGVHDGEHEDARGHHVERLDLGPLPKGFDDGLAARIGIGGERPGEGPEDFGRRRHPITIYKDGPSDKRFPRGRSRAARTAGYSVACA